MSTTTTSKQNPMPIDPRFLTLTQWLSPAYPVGAFAWSHGLETAVLQKWVTDAESLYDWLQTLLTQGTGQSDAVLIGLAFAATDNRKIIELNTIAQAFAPSQERLRESMRQGQAFARVTCEIWGTTLPDCVLPLALGRAARLMDMDVEDVTALYLHSFASNLVSAAQRLMPLGQTAAQTVLARLTDTCAELSQRAVTADVKDLQSHCFLSDIAAMRHETQQPRLFQS